MRATVLLLSLLSLNGCEERGASTAADCRRQLSGRRIAMGINGHTDETALAVHEARCDQWERDERQEARERAHEKRTEEVAAH